MTAALNAILREKSRLEDAGQSSDGRLENAASTLKMMATQRPTGAMALLGYARRRLGPTGDQLHLPRRRAVRPALLFDAGARREVIRNPTISKPASSRWRVFVATASAN
jgi:hypothetical protein